MKKTISIFTTIEGHQSISTALEEILKEADFKVYVNSHHGKEFKFYRTLYRHFPTQWGYIYKLGKTKVGQELAQEYAESTYIEPLYNQLKRQKPDIIISTWFMLNSILSEYAQLRRMPFINVIANPRSIHPREVDSYGYNLVFDDVAETACKQMGIRDELIIPIGWFVQKKFNQKLKTEELKLKMGVNPNALVFLVQSGSEGTQKSFKLLKRLIQTESPKTPTHFFFACGNNQKLLEQATFLKEAYKAPLKLAPLPFTKRIEMYMYMADCVIGKAGPNTIFEAAATKTPFLATHHIAGQENGNVELIDHYQLGYSHKKIDNACLQIQTIMAQPSILDQFNQPLAQMARYNHNAGKVLVKFINKL